MSQVDTVVFDLGGVLIDWNPRYVYSQMIDDPAEMEDFLASICSESWIAEQDRGRSLADGVAQLAGRHPDKAELIEAFLTRWPEMLRGAIDETVAILAELRARHVPLYALSNWPADTWQHGLERFPFLQWFDGIVISGLEGTAKPDAEIYKILLERHQIDAHRSMFIDDRHENIAAAERVGMRGVLFTHPLSLRRALEALTLV